MKYYCALNLYQIYCLPIHPSSTSFTVVTMQSMGFTLSLGKKILIAHVAT